ncbi:helix-turn-helix domain-containing protein [Halostagnicola sp. A56]|uniref:helix-turn-helix domain-containing protein n=1 Tax=Halostagnicola sp. A56 TaxID=1495067 RepID=UPI0009E57532|nr:helix-turn-helix domain-containing protein [Halostagnicola sp. A56]
MPEETPGGRGKTIQSVESALDVVEVIRQKERAGVTEIANELDRSKSTVHHYVTTLVKHDYLDKVDGEYQLSLRFLTLGGQVRERERLYHLGKDDVEELAQETGEQTRLIVERNGSGITLYEFSEKSITYKSAISPSSHTREAIPSLLSGFYPDIFAANGYRYTRGTIADQLSEYRTAAFHSNPYVSRAYGFDSGFDTFEDDLLLGQNRLLALAQTALNKFFFKKGDFYARAEEINERSLSWLDSRDDDRFFLWNHYMDPHGPYNPPSKYNYADQELSNDEAQTLYQKTIDHPEKITETMERSSASRDEQSTELVVEIVDTLEACGLDPDSYQLYDYVDIEALEQVCATSSGDPELRFTIEGIRIAVTPDTVTVLLDESNTTPE